MSVSGVTSSSYNPYQLNTANSLQQLSKDLQSGSLSAAQSDFASLQAAFSSSPTTTASTSTASTSTASTSNPVAQAFNQLASDLKSGDLSGAQKAVSTLQQDLGSKDDSSATRMHNHHRFSAGVGASNSQNPLLQQITQLGQDLSSGDLSAAQQAYAALQTQVSATSSGMGNNMESPVAGNPISMLA
jgi:hypothetical protein